MIFGIGTDIVAVSRMEKIFHRHGARVLEKILAPDERADCSQSPDPPRFLAKRFAAKEALGKSLGTGIRAPLIMPSIWVRHDAAGKPYFQLCASAQNLLTSRNLVAHLSISDERDHALAFVVLETT